MRQFLIEGGPVMWPLLFLSFLSMSFIIERSLFFFFRACNRKTELINRILQSAEAGDIEKAEHLASQGRQDFVVRTLYEGLSHSGHSLTQALETQAMAEMRSIRKNLSLLSTTITAAPLLGILGTVIGIIGSFDALGTSGIGDPVAVTKGISEALITTAFGLMISLGTLIPFNFFQSRVRRATEELEKYSSILEIVLQRRSKREYSGFPEPSREPIL